jgi:hypothetical protein
VKYNWVRIADTINEFHFPPDNIIEIQAGEKTICLGRYGGDLFAFAQKVAKDST